MNPAPRGRHLLHSHCGETPCSMQVLGCVIEAEAQALAFIALMRTIPKPSRGSSSKPSPVTSPNVGQRTAKTLYVLHEPSRSGRAIVPTSWGPANGTRGSRTPGCAPAACGWARPRCHTRFSPSPQRRDSSSRSADKQRGFRRSCTLPAVDKKQPSSRRRHRPWGSVALQQGHACVEFTDTSMASLNMKGSRYFIDILNFLLGSSCVSGGWRDQQFDQRAQQRFAPLSYIVNELEEPQVKG